MKRLIKIFFILLIIVPIGVSTAWSGNEAILHKAQDAEKLLTTVQVEGTVGVIIKLDVPDIEKLTAASNAFKVNEIGIQDKPAALQADTQLSMAISTITDQVISNLQLLGPGFEISHTYSTMPLLALRVTEDTLQALASMPEVLMIEENRVDRVMLNSSVGIIGADDAWTSGYTGEGWYVAIVDSGVRTTHEFFAGKSIVEACFASGPDGVGPAGDCPDGKSSMTGSGAAAPHPSSYAGYDHGTHVAGIAAGNNGSLFGVARDADIIAIQAFSKFSNCPGNCVSALVADVLKAFEHVYLLRSTYNIAAVNYSAGGGAYSSACDSDSRKLAIDNLRSVGIATFAASGNNGYCGLIGAPACISSAIAVGATTDLDAEASFNNWSETLMDLFAPGVSINSASAASDTSYTFKSGTSMATPHVSGAYALLREKNSQLSVTELMSALTSTGVSVTTGCSPQTASKPRIQVDAALDSIAPGTSPSKGTGSLLLLLLGASGE